MDLRKEILTGMLRTTGSKRVSVIIQDKKGRYLIAEKAGVEEEPIEFPSFFCKDAKIALIIFFITDRDRKSKTIKRLGFYKSRVGTYRFLYRESE